MGILADGLNANGSKDAAEGIMTTDTVMKEVAVEFTLGARGLRSICEAVMKDLMFDAPSSDLKSFVVTKQYAEQKFEASASTLTKQGE